MIASNAKGWAVPHGCREAHYFVFGRALCGYPVAYSGKVEDDKHDHPDNCFTCMRLRIAGVENKTTAVQGGTAHE